MRSSEENVATKLQRIAIKASKDKRCQFTSLFHLMNKELKFIERMNGLLNELRQQRSAIKTWPEDDEFDNEYTDYDETRENRDIPRPQKTEKQKYS